MSRGITITTSLDMITEQCCNCGILFAITKDFHDRARAKPGANGIRFYCPNGHDQFYVGESEATKLRRERDRLAQQIAQKDDEIAEARRQAEAEVKARKRIEKRVNNGVCPCCTRSFQNLKRHMATKHPNVVDFKAA